MKLASLRKKPWYPKLKIHLVSFGHTFAAAFIVAVAITYKESNIVDPSQLSIDAIFALCAALARSGVKAGIQAISELIVDLAKK